MMAAPADYQSLPKVELHDHVAGSVRPSTIREFVLEDGLPIEMADVYGPAATGEGLATFLTRLVAWDACVRTPERMARVLRELRADLAADGVIYAEPRLRPPAGDDDGLWDALVDASLDAVSGGAGPRIAFIMTLLRGCDLAHAEREVRRAARWVGRGVVGFDVVGDESIDAAPLVPALLRARDAGLGLSIHAGEITGAESVRRALEQLAPDRLAHGVGAAADPDLLARLRDRGTHLEMALTSNVQTRAVASLKAHPFPRLLRAGLSVGLNPDDRAICGTTLSDEYAVAAGLGVTRAELALATQHAARAAFLPAAETEALVQEVRRGWADAH